MSIRKKERERESYKITTKNVTIFAISPCLRPNLERGIDGKNSLIVLLIRSKYLRVQFDESNNSRNWALFCNKIFFFFFFCIHDCMTKNKDEDIKNEDDSSE